MDSSLAPRDRTINSAAGCCHKSASRGRSLVAGASADEGLALFSVGGVRDSTCSRYKRRVSALECNKLAVRESSGGKRKSCSIKRASGVSTDCAFHSPRASLYEFKRSS